jgi:hypothetical protein
MLYKLYNKLANYLSNFMELSPSLEANNCSANQVLSFSWQLKFHYRANKPSAALDSEPNEFSPYPIIFV